MARITFEFISEPDDSLKCSICLEVAQNPMQHGAIGCGKLFCKECIDKHGTNPCPTCRGKNPEYYKDVRSSREIQALRVKCMCDWEGDHASVEDHVARRCGHAIVKCSRKCQSNGKYVFLKRKDLENHLRTKCPNRSFRCSYCGKEGTYASITEKHDRECSKKPIPCPNSDCTIIIERERVQEHLASACDHSTVYCKYNNVGCTEKRKRKDIKIHEDDDKVHLLLALKKTSELYDTQRKMSKMIREMSTTIRELQGKKTVLFSVPGYVEKKKKSQVFLSDPFFTVPNGYKMSIVVYCNGKGADEGNYVSVFAQLLDVPYKKQLKWPFKGTVTFELLNQLADIGHSRTEVPFINNREAKVGSDGWGRSKCIHHSKLSYNAATKTQYLINDTLHFRVTVHEKNERFWLEEV